MEAAQQGHVSGNDITARRRPARGQNGQQANCQSQMAQVVHAPTGDKKEHYDTHEKERVGLPAGEGGGEETEQGEMEEAHVPCEVIAREAIEASYDEKSKEMFDQHELGGEEGCGGEDEGGGGDEGGCAADRGQGAVEEQRREDAHDGMGGYGGNEGTEQQLPRKHEKERKAWSSVIGSSTALGTNEGLGVSEIHGGIAFEAQRNDEKIESLKKDSRGQEDGLVTPGKDDAWFCERECEIGKDVPAEAP